MGGKCVWWCVALSLVLGSSSLRTWGQELTQEQKELLDDRSQEAFPKRSRFFIQGILGPLNKKMDGRLDPLIDGLAARSKVTWYLLWPRGAGHGSKSDYEDYQTALVFVLEQARQVDAFVAMGIADVLVDATPPEFVIDMIGPHIGKGGKLEGMLDDRNEWIDMIERVRSGYRPNERSFYAYEDYLFGKSRNRLASRANADVIVTHMFKTDCTLAMETMLRGWPYRMSYDRKKDAYGFHRGSGGGERIDAYIREGWELAQVNVGVRASRDLARLRLILPKVQTVILKGELAKLSTHDTWWIRLYVSESMRQTPPLCEVDVLKKLRQDEREEIRKSAEEALKVASEYARAVEFRKKKEEAERRKRGE